MPIEIKELHIRVAVNAPGHTQQEKSGEKKPARDEERDTILAQCVEQVLHILQKKMER